MSPMSRTPHCNLLQGATTNRGDPQPMVTESGPTDWDRPLLLADRGPHPFIGTDVGKQGLPHDLGLLAVLLDRDLM